LVAALTRERDDLMAIFRDSMFIKPERHHLRLGERSSRMRAFSEIGGLELG
jgi:hypothetical protein